MAELATNCYDSRMVGSNGYIYIYRLILVIDGRVLVYIPIMDYRAHMHVHVYNVYIYIY